MARIILASGSPRRQELLQRIGLREFEISVPDVEEWYPPELAPEDIVAYISREKSQAVQAPADAIVITADTMVFLDDQRLGKPHDEAEALSMLTALSGRKHKVCTGVTVPSPAPSPPTSISGRPPGRSCWPTSGAASPGIRPGPTAYRGRERCWWSASMGTFLTSWVCRWCC